jgi:thiol-disulfide isomerase/thioredoxin
MSRTKEAVRRNGPARTRRGQGVSRQVARQRARRGRRRGIPRRGVLWGGGAALVLAVILVLVFVGGGGGSGVRPSAARQVRAGAPRTTVLQTGQAVPDFAAPRMSGGRVSWSDYRGSPTVLVGWAPWCPHCQKELPVLGEISRAFPGVRVVTVVTAIGLHPGPTADGFMEAHGLAFPVAVDDAAGTIAASLGVQSFPTVYYVRPDGTVEAAVQGEEDPSTIRQRFQTLASEA